MADIRKRLRDGDSMDDLVDTRHVYRVRGHEWLHSGASLWECRLCFALSYGGTGAIVCPAGDMSRYRPFLPVRNRRRRAQEARERRGMSLSLRHLPTYVICSACKRLLRDAPAGLALGIRTRVRWLDGMDGPIKTPNGRILSIRETPDVCSGECFDAVLADDRYLVRERDDDGLAVGSLLPVRGELVFVYGGAQTQKNVERVLRKVATR